MESLNLSETIQKDMIKSDALIQFKYLIKYLSQAGDLV